MSTEFTTTTNSTANQNQSQNTNTSSAFAAALQRARQIAAKINPAGASSNTTTATTNSSESLKRPLEDSGDQPEAKKSGNPMLNNSNESASSNGNPSNGGGTSDDSSPSQSATQAARVAAAAAVGIQGIGSPGVSLGPVTSKNIKVPDKMVGLIIGRGGEQITRLQAESGCKIQMAPDSGGLPDRVCTLTGSNQSICRAEDMILQVIQSRAREVLPGPGSSSSGMSPVGNNMSSAMARITEMVKQPNMMSNNNQSGYTQVEIMIPGPKVGLIIGKGGESIKQLQEKSGAKMVIIQDGPNQQEVEKPLRISGEVSRVEHARTLVQELLAEKEQIMRRNRGLSGNVGNGPGYNSGMPGSGSHGWDGEQIETTISVPAGKCGVIIGKGGETIRLINQQTGAFCEIDRKQHPNATEKTFIIRGSRDQIEHAKRLFSDKLNMSLNTGPMNGPMNGPGYGIAGGMQGGGPGGPHSYGGNQWPGAQQYQQQQQWHAGQQQQGPQIHGASGAGNPGAGSSQVQINPVTGQPDYSTQWIEYYRSMGCHREAALIEEQSKTNKMQSAQSQMGMQAQMQAQQQQQQQQLQMQAVQNQQMGGMPGGGIQSQPMAGGVPQQQQPQQAQQQQQPPQQQQQTSADQSNQPDYSAQWAVYYRSLGKIKEAEAIEAQMKAKGLATSTQAQSGLPNASTSAAVPNMYGQQQQAAAMYAYQQAAVANPAAGTPATGFYAGATQQQAATASQYAYPNYAANYAQQQPTASSEPRQ